jgi:hypothetical protein
MYTFDLFRDDRFLACLGRYSAMNHADAAAFDMFTAHGAKPENAGVRWQVRQAVYDGEGELDHTVLVTEYVATA